MPKQWIVTGASGSLGLNLSVLAAENGDQVIGIGRSAGSSFPGKSFFLDFAKPLESQADATKIFSALNSDCVLVLAAASAEPTGRLSNLSDKEIEFSLGVNFTSQIQLIRMFLQAQTRQQDGAQATVACIASGAAGYPMAGLSFYCSYKAAMEMMIKCLALDYPQVRFFNIRPGVFESSMQKALRSKTQFDFASARYFADLHQTGRLKTAREVAVKLYSLLSDPHAHPSGSTLNLEIL